MKVSDLSALRYRCRRGMLELDVRLRDFIDKHGSNLTASDCKVFAEILERPDPVIFDYIFANAKPNSAAEADLIEKIKAT